MLSRIVSLSINAWLHKSRFFSFTSVPRLALRWGPEEWVRTTVDSYDCIFYLIIKGLVPSSTTKKPPSKTNLKPIDEDEETSSDQENTSDGLAQGFYEIKIKNELNEKIDFDLLKIPPNPSHEFPLASNSGRQTKSDDEACASHDRLKIDYVPVGKIITISVSMMWWSQTKWLFLFLSS